MAWPIWLNVRWSRRPNGADLSTLTKYVVSPVFVFQLFGLPTLWLSPWCWRLSLTSGNYSVFLETSWPSSLPTTRIWQLPVVLEVPDQWGFPLFQRFPQTRWVEPLSWFCRDSTITVLCLLLHWLFFQFLAFCQPCDGGVLIFGTYTDVVTPPVPWSSLLVAAPFVGFFPFLVFPRRSTLCGVRWKWP